MPIDTGYVNHKTGRYFYQSFSATVYEVQTKVRVSVSPTTTDGHGYKTGEFVILSAFSADLNGTYAITVINKYTFELIDKAWFNWPDKSGTVTAVLTCPDGTSWENAWDRIPDGNQINKDGLCYIAKTDNPLALNQSGTWTKDTSVLTLQTSLIGKLIQGFTGNVLTSAGAGITVSATTGGRYKLGSGSQKISFATSFMGGKAAYMTLPDTLNLSDFSRLNIWFETNNVTSLNYYSDIRICLCSDSIGDVIINEFTLKDARENNVINAFVFNNENALGSTINSIAIYCNKIISNITLNLSAFSASKDIDISNVIGKSGQVIGGEWYAINYFDEYSIILDDGTTTTSVFAYMDETETTGIYFRETISAAGIYITGLFNQPNGTRAECRFGMNPLTDTQDGETWYDGKTYRGQVVGLTRTHSFSNICGLRGMHGIYCNTNFFELKNVTVIASTIGILCSSLSDNHGLYNKFRNILMMNCGIGNVVYGNIFENFIMKNFYNTQYTSIVSFMSNNIHFKGLKFINILNTQSYIAILFNGNNCLIESPEFINTSHATFGGYKNRIASLVANNAAFYSSIDNIFFNCPDVIIGGSHINTITGLRRHEIGIKPQIGRINIEWQTVFKRVNDLGAWKLYGDVSPYQLVTDISPRPIKLVEMALEAYKPVIIKVWLYFVENSIVEGELLIRKYFNTVVNETVSVPIINSIASGWNEYALSITPDYTGIAAIELKLNSINRNLPDNLILYIGSVTVIM